MSWKNTEKQYGKIAAGFHWVVALIVLSLLGLGLYMVRLDPSPFMFKLYFWHKSLGILVLFLMVWRLLWRVTNKPPAPLPHYKNWEKILARCNYIFFYTALLSMPLAGWIMSSAKGYPVSVFGWFTLPDFVDKSKSLAGWAEKVHEVLGYILIGAITIHLAGALKHHFIDRDETLSRMVPARKKETKK